MTGIAVPLLRFLAMRETTDEKSNGKRGAMSDHHDLGPAAQCLERYCHCSGSRHEVGVRRGLTIWPCTMHHDDEQRAGPSVGVASQTHLDASCRLSPIRSEGSPTPLAHCRVMGAQIANEAVLRLPPVLQSPLRTLPIYLPRRWVDSAVSPLRACRRLVHTCAIPTAELPGSPATTWPVIDQRTTQHVTSRHWIDTQMPYQQHSCWVHQ